jgi:flagellar biosynthesis protein FlhG
MKILPIASGKGGVGKSLLATNLAIALAEGGNRVVLADLDLGASNLHTILGLRNLKNGIGAFLNNPKMRLEDIIIETSFKGLRFIPGDAEIPELADLKHAQKRSLIKSLLALDADFLIIDLGGGTSFNVIDFFLLSGRGIIVSTPQLTSILNAYLFIKNAVFRIMSSTFQKSSGAANIIEKLKKDGTSLQKVYIPKLLEKIKEADKSSYDEFIKHISTFRPCLVLNMVIDPKENDKAIQLRRSVKEYLNLDLEHLGVIAKDVFQDIALNSRIPVIQYKPNALISQAIYRIADKITQFEAELEGPLDFKNLEETYKIADIEAENDFETKMEYLEELLHCGELSNGDLMEIIKSQQFEIEKLKKENMLFKSKMIKAIDQGFAI